MSRFAVIMAGGSGTRFWPKSSQKKPKQFLNLSHPKLSMLQTTFNRLSGVVPKKNRWVIGTKTIETQVKKHLGPIQVLSEPQGRNTMAAACWSAWSVFQKDPEGIIALLPADSFIADEAKFRLRLEKAFQIAENQERIVCLGIQPTFAAIGYGYIETKTPISSGGSAPILRFVEKPNLETAQSYLKTGLHLWNAGIFVFKAKVFISEVKTWAPEFYNFFEAHKKSPAKLVKNYSQLPSIPIDIAIMEKTHIGEVVSGDYGWNDVGSWAALKDVNKVDEAENLFLGTEESLSIASTNNTVDVNGKRFVALLGVKDLIVVETKDVVLVCHRDQAQNIKQVVDYLKTKKKLKPLL